MPLFNPPSTDTLDWGADSVAATITTRYLFPWYDDTLAPTSPIQWRSSRAGVARNMRVRHNVTAGNGNAIVYTLRINGVATALLVSLASTAADGSDLVNSVSVPANALLDVEVTKALAIGTSPDNITVSMEYV